MKITLSVLEAEVGSPAGPAQVSCSVLEAARARIEPAGFVLDYSVCRHGGGIAILIAHTRGPGDEYVRALAREAVCDARQVAREQGTPLVQDRFPALLELELAHA